MLPLLYTGNYFTSSLHLFQNYPCLQVQTIGTISSISPLIRDQGTLLPSRISYNTVEIPLEDGTKIRIPRRELFDVRMQLMAEDSDPNAPVPNHSTILSMLGDTDIKKSVYEGGLKTWECSLDLVTYLGNNEFFLKSLSKDPTATVHVLEVIRQQIHIPFPV